MVDRVKEIIKGWMLDSDFKTVSPSESDKESDYMTGLEDFPDGAAKKTKNESVPKNITTGNDELCHTSSFIQDILSEDSRAGVAVVDLFVAVKKAKDDLDVLSKCNSELFYNINDLGEKTKFIKTEYKNLSDITFKFLERINEDVPVWNHQLLKQESSSSTFLPEGENLTVSKQGPNPQEMENSREKPNQAFTEEICNDCRSGKNNSLEQNSRSTEDRCQGCEMKQSEKLKACSKCGRSLKSKTADIDSLGSFMAQLKGRSLKQQPIFTEALLGSFLASFLWLLKRQEGPKMSVKNSYPASPAPEEEKEEHEEEGFSLNESTVQIICDICEILNEATFQEMDLKERPYFSLKRPEQPDENLNLSNWVSKDSNLQDRCRTPARKSTVSDEELNRKHLPLKEVISFALGANSTADYLNCVNEALVFFKNNKSSNRAEAREAKEDSMSEGESDFEEALTGPFMPLPQPELRAKPSVSCMGDLTKTVMGKKSASTLTPANNNMSSYVGRISDEIKTKIKKIKPKTSVRVMEQTLKKSQKPLKKSAGNVQFTISANTPIGVFDVSVVQYVKHRFSSRNGSENSLHNSDMGSVEEGYTSAEDELEEFLEVYLENPKTRKESESVVCKKDVLKTIILKTDKVHFFEIQKCYPSYFVLQIIQKTPNLKQNECMELEKFKNAVAVKDSCSSDEKQKKQRVIERGSNDLVIYIQVEVEEGLNQSSGGLVVEYKTSSFGTQTSEDNSESNLFSSERIIRLSENEQDGESLFQIWKECDSIHSGGSEEERITFDESFMMSEKSEEDIKKELSEEELADVEEKVLMAKELKEKTVTFSEKLSQLFTEEEMQEPYPEEEDKIMGTAQVVILREEKHRADVWFSQKILTQRIDVVVLQEIPITSPEIIETINFNAVELAKALTLIREIENDIVDVKIDDAITILPLLESELRKHLQNKIKNMGDKETEVETSVDHFFSAVDFWPYGESEENDNHRSQERLHNLLKLLSNLEETIKFNEYFNKKIDICEFSSSKIYELLHALTVNIQELEEHPNVSSLSQTLDIASQLDTAVREYDNKMKSQPLDCVAPEKRLKRKSKSPEEMPAKHHLKNVRKKVFEMVEEEAFNLEERIERDFDRLEQIEKENDEAMTFLEAFLQKTERRMLQLTNLKTERKDLSNKLNNMCQKYWDIVMQKTDKEKDIEAEKQNLQKKESKEKNIPPNPRRDLSPMKEEPVRETVSGLLIALDSLKSRAREKKDVCKEILLSAGMEKESENSSRRSSRSSFTAKHAEKLTSSVKEYKRIGDTSLYLCWSQPEGILKDSIVGYQIYVNGKLNQKVRNPQRLQAVLYSIDFTKNTQVHLYALAENNSKILLATVGY